MTNAEMAQEALSRAVNGASLSNYPAIYQGFMERGIPEDDIQPRENVFTYHAWRARGRQVERGQHGVKVLTWITVAEKTDKATGEVVKKSGRFCKTTTVFHVSQTAPIA